MDPEKSMLEQEGEQKEFVIAHERKGYVLKGGFRTIEEAESWMESEEGKRAMKEVGGTFSAREKTPEDVIEE